MLLGVGQKDTQAQVQTLVDKIVHLFLYSPSYHLLLGSKSGMIYAFYAVVSDWIELLRLTCRTICSWSRRWTGTV